MLDIAKRLIGPVIVVGILLAGFRVWTANGASKKKETTYETAEVTRGDIKSFVSAPGVIQPWKVVDVKANVGGRIDALYVDLGAIVKKGQVIARIDPTDTEAQFKQSRADLTAAQARKAQAVVNLKQQEQTVEARIASARQAVASAEARLAQAKANMDVQPDLTRLEIEQAKASLSTAEKQASQAEKSRTQLAEQLNELKNVTIPLDIETVLSNENQARTNVETADREYRRQQRLLGQGYVSRAELESAYARLASLRATLRTAEQRRRTLEQENALKIRQMQARLDESDAAVAAANARVEQARSAVNLAEKNAVQNEVTRQAYEAARAAVDQARAELRAAEAEQQQIQVRRKEIEATQAQIVRSQAAFEQAKQNRTYTEVIAPFDGVIIAKNVEVGTVVPSSRQAFGGTSALLQIGDMTQQWVVCNVDETDIGQISVGQKVTVKVDAYPSRLIDGQVIRIDPQAKVEQQVTMIPVTVRISEPSPDFKPLMNADCEFIVDERTDVLQVPNEALKEDNGTFRVQVMDDGAKTPRDVEVLPGLAGQDTTEILEGLEEGQKVVTKTILPEKSEVTNPFGGPFGQRPQRQNSPGNRPGGR